MTTICFMNIKYLLLSSLPVFCASTGPKKRNTVGQRFSTRPSVQRSFFLRYLFSFFLDSPIQSLQCLEVTDHCVFMLDALWKKLHIVAIAITFSLFIFICWPVSDKSSWDSAGLTPNTGIHKCVEREGNVLAELNHKHYLKQQ